MAHSAYQHWNVHLRALLHSSDVTASKDWKFQSLAPATSLQWLSADTESRQPRSPIKGNRALGLLPSLLFHLLTVPFKESRQNLHPFVQKPQLVWFCMFQVPSSENRYQIGFYEMLAKEREDLKYAGKVWPMPFKTPWFPCQSKHPNNNDNQKCYKHTENGDSEEGTKELSFVESEEKGRDTLLTLRQQRVSFISEQTVPRMGRKEGVGHCQGSPLHLKPKPHGYSCVSPYVHITPSYM